MNSAMISMIQRRVSSPRLTAPAPDAETLDKIYQCALRAPDHMMLRPWRYLVVDESSRAALGEVFASSAQALDSALTDRQREKYRAMPLRAPMMIIAIATNVDHSKVPAQEQVLSCGAGVAYMLLGLQAEGFGGIWRTGALAENPFLKSSLGIAEHESIVGFLYIGTPCGEPKAVPLNAVDDYFHRWQP